MIIDFDDFGQENHRLDLLWRLKEVNPLFRCTLFAVPANGEADFWDSVPHWAELAVHGWEHPDPSECANWSEQRMNELIYEIEDNYPWFRHGFKAPGWQISDGCYQALDKEEWWIADQKYNDLRRPVGIYVHRLGDGDHWHGHIQDVMGNGLEERFEELEARVREETHFEWVSESVTAWRK